MANYLPRDTEPEMEVVWHGGMANDPLGGFTKGCLLEPREQGEDEARANANDTDIPSTAEFRAGVARLNNSLRRPLDLSKPWGDGK